MANLLQKASIVLTPTAYDNGKVLCAKPSEAPYGDFDFSRNSAATRVNAQGLVENVQILSSNLVQNGDFSEEGVQEISNGSFSQEGVEEITNGDFSSDTAWAKASGTTISDGKLNITANSTNDRTFQNVGMVQGKIYKLVLEVSNYQSGSLFILFGGSGTPNIPNITSNGTYTFYQECIGANGYFYFGGNLFDGSIDNVSVREVGQDWDLRGWEISENKATCDASGGALTMQQQGVLTSGKTYKITYTILDYVQGVLRFRSSPVSGGYTSGNGEHTFYIVAQNATFGLQGLNGFIGSVTNISVKEVGMDWDLGTGWSIAENKAISDATQGYITQTDVSGAGVTATYKVQWTQNITTGTRLRFFARNYNDGGNATTLSITRDDGTSMSGGNCVGSGTFTAYVSSTNGYSFKLLAETGAEADITNITTIEITDDTNLPRINYENGCGSWLFEPQSTNLLTYSEDFSNAYWTKSNSTITSNDAISPDGTQNAALLTDDTSTTFHRVQTSESVTSGVSYSQSVFVKKGVNRYFYLGTNNFSFWDFTFFDLENNVAVNTPSGISTEVEVLSNGWVRLKATKLSNATGFFNFCFGTSDTTTTIYTGDSTGKVHIYGAQLETLSYATSYIPTSGSTVTRNQDVCTNGGSLATINSTEGTLYAEIAALVSSGTPREITISDGTTGNRVMITYPSSNNIRVNYRVNSVNVFDRTFNTTVTDYNKIALKWKLNDFSFYVNGTEISKSTSGSVFPPNTLNTLNFDSANGGFPFFGKTKCLAVWKEALTDEALTELTTI